MGHDVDTEMDWARLELSKFETVGNLQIKALSAQAEFAFRMSEVAEKQVKVATDKVHLQNLKQASLEFVNTRHRLQAEVTKLQNRQALIQRELNWLRKVSLGQSLPRAMRTHVWSAFYFFIQMIDGEPDMPAPANVFDSVNFVEGSVSNDHNTPWLFLLYLRSKNMMPRTGSAAMRYIYNILHTMTAAADASLLRTTELLKEEQAKLEKLQAAAWQTVNVGSST